MHSALRTFFPAIARRLLPFLLVIAALVTSRSAAAGGKVTLASKEVVESDGRWKVNMTIDYGAAPPLPHMAMVFAFTPVVQYERTLTDKSGETPVLTKIPLRNQTPINESLDVGFSDGTGKIFKLTKFDFVIRRDHGFEAGEYDLKITRESDGGSVGQVIHLTLKGDNVVVDRRAMDFSKSSHKKVEKDPTAEAKQVPIDESKKADDAPAASDETAPSTPPSTDDDRAPPAVAPKQGGCGCRVADAPIPGSSFATLAALALGLAFAARRRSR